MQEHGHGVVAFDDRGLSLKVLDRDLVQPGNRGIELATRLKFYYIFRFVVPQFNYKQL